MRRCLPALGLLWACGGDHPATDAGAGPAAPGPPADAAELVVPIAHSDPHAPAYPPPMRTVEMRRAGIVRVAPDDQANKLGVVSDNTRMPFRGAAPPGHGCKKRWIEIAPAGWICEEMVAPSRRGPMGAEFPLLERGELVPGTYGKVTAAGARSYIYKNGKLAPGRELAGSVNVRSYAELTLDLPLPPPAPAVPPPSGSRIYWLIGKDEVVPLDQLTVHEPSTFHGVRLGDETGLALPIGFAVESSDLHRGVSSSQRRLPPRSPWPVLEIERGPGGAPRAYRIGADDWVPAAKMRLAEVTPPPDRTLPLERWFDVDLDRQVLVAYEGETPVYATLVSTGNKKWPTATGIYRTWIKFSETNMSGQMGDEAPYSVATVPWTQYFSKDLALHTSYWHDGFGEARSHGCVNLAPIDSRFLYFWSDPAVPPGWSMAHGHIQRPGSMVRVRSAADPNPELKGYARDVWAARQ